MSDPTGSQGTSHRAGYMINLAQWLSIFGVYLASLAIISHLLDRAEIGRFGIGAAIYAILNILCSFGAERTVVQVRALGAPDVTAAFGLSLGVSTLASLLLLAVSGPVAGFYGDQSVAPVLQIVALALLATPLQSTLQGLLQRKLQFGRLYTVNTGSTVLGAASGVFLAWCGWGSAALAWGLAVEAVAKAAIALACCRLPPIVWPRRTTWRDAAVFGASAVGTNLLTGLSETLPALLSGHLLSIEAVGLLNRAQRMVQILQDAVQKSVKVVALPALAAGQRTQAELRAPYLLKISYLTGLAWPVFLMIAVTAGSIVQVMLGPQWTAAIPILRILALGGLALPFSAMNISFFTVLERLDTVMRIQAGLLPLQLGLLGAACWYGNLATLAAAIVALQFLRAAVVSHSLARLLHLPRGAAWRVSLPSILPATAAALAGSLAEPLAAAIPITLAPALGGLLTLALAGSAAGLAWLFTICFMRHPLCIELQAMRHRIGSAIATYRQRRIA